MEHIVMTPVGWVFMIAAWAVVGSLTFWCFYKLVTTEPGGGPDDAADEGGDGGDAGT